MLDSKLGKKSEFSQESVASMATVIMDRIREKDAEWKLEKEVAENEKADAISRAQEAKTNIEDFRKQLEEAQEKISSLEANNFCTIESVLGTNSIISDLQVLLKNPAIFASGTLLDMAK